MKIFQFLGRTALTIWLLVLVYRGSRVALVAVLALIFAWAEIVNLLLIRKNK